MIGGVSLDNYSIKDLEEFQRNACEILRKNSQYATAKAVEEVFNVVIFMKRCVEGDNK